MPNQPQSFTAREAGFVSEVLCALQRLQTITSGQIERARGRSKGQRPMTIRDARNVAAIAAERLVRAINAFAPVPPGLDTVAAAHPAATPVTVHLEPSDMRGEIAETCVDCHQPTRYWITDKRTPLCPACCIQRNLKSALAKKPASRIPPP